MKRTILAMVLGLSMVGAAISGPWAETYAPGGTSFAITNEQANSVWMPVAVLWKFAPATTNATLSVIRTSQSNSYELARLTVTNASTVIWVAEAQYPFERGDILQVCSTATNSVVQVIRRGM